MRPIVELTLQLSELLRRLDKKPTDLQAEYGIITDEHINQLRDDSWTDISRAELQILFALSRSLPASEKPFQLIVDRPHPLWQTFATGDAIVFRSRKPPRDREIVEDSDVLNELLRQTDLDARDAEVVSKGDRLDVLALVHEHNAIFTGSPKFNEHAETALAHVFGMKPFDESAENRKKSPIQYYWNNWNEMRKLRARGSAFCEQSTKTRPHGLTIRTPGGKDRHFPTIPRFDRATEGWDIGVLVAKRFRIDSVSPVTSIFIAGHSGFSARMIARDIAVGGIYLGESAMAEPYVLRFLLCAWKRKGTSTFEPYARSRRWFRSKDFKEIAARLSRPVRSAKK